MSSSEASSSEPESTPHPAKRDAKGKSRKTSKGKQPTVVATPHGKNEGVNPDWAYKPPEGAKVLDIDEEDTADFDWDTLQDSKDLELWVMRVPEGISGKSLDNLKLDVPSGSSFSTARLGSLDRKSTTYDVWTVGDESNDLVGAEELKSLSLMVPRKKKHGKLFLAPKLPIRHVVICAQPAAPSQDVLSADAGDMSWRTHQNPPRPSYPKEMLKHRFVPFGSLTSDASADDAAHELDGAEPPLTQTPTAKKKKDEEVKSKKRKVEADGCPRKSKKSATAT